MAVGRRCGGNGEKVWGMAHPYPASHRHGTATPGVHMEIIVKFSEALPCVKSPVSRTAGPILRGDVSGKRFSTHVGKETWLT